MPHHHSKPVIRSRYIRTRPVVNYYYSEPECYCDGEPCICPPDTAGLARDPILTKGFYWYDANPAQAPGFLAWLRDNSSLVKSRKSTTSIDTSPFSVLTGGAKAHIWTLFEVLFPVPWLDAKQFGFPNTATADTDVTISSRGAEPTEDALDTVANGVKKIMPFLAPVSSGVLVIGGLVGLGYIFRKELFHGLKQVRHIRRSRSR